MTSHDILVHLIRTLDRTTLGCSDDCPPGSAWIDFVAPVEVDILEGGKFFPEHDQIDIYREGAPRSPAGAPLDAAEASLKPTEELVWLAHELGHLKSKLSGHQLPPENVPEKVYGEEVRAWRFARRLLHDNAFTEWRVFDALHERALGTYRDTLKLSERQANAIADLVRADA
jgi:hypothetical protein